MKVKQKLEQAVYKYENLIFGTGLFSGIGGMVAGGVTNYIWGSQITDSAQNFLMEQIRNDGPVSSLVKRLLRDNDVVDSVFSIKDHAALAAKQTMECLNNCQVSWPQTSIIEILKERGMDITANIQLPSEIMVVGGIVTLLGSIATAVVLERNRGR